MKLSRSEDWFAFAYSIGPVDKLTPVTSAPVLRAMGSAIWPQPHPTSKTRWSDEMASLDAVRLTLFSWADTNDAWPSSKKAEVYSRPSPKMSFINSGEVL